MTSEQFAYWFQGFAELSPTPPTQEQWDSMRAHVSTVFNKVTPEVRVTVGPGTDSKTVKDCLPKFPHIAPGLLHAHPWPHIPTITC